MLQQQPKANTAVQNRVTFHQSGVQLAVTRRTLAFGRLSGWQNAIHGDVGQLNDRRAVLTDVMILTFAQSGRAATTIATDGALNQ